MGRKLTFLKTEKGWPYSRQHTSRLVKNGKVPPPEKAYPGGLVNIWDEDVFDAFQASNKTDTDGGEAA
jgi:hypothetical protein